MSFLPVMIPVLLISGVVTMLFRERLVQLYCRAAPGSCDDPAVVAQMRRKVWTLIAVDLVLAAAASYIQFA